MIETPLPEPSLSSEPPPSRKMATDAIGSVMARLAEAQIRAPLKWLFLVFVLSGALAWQATRLELRTRYDQLLPDNQTSVVELRRVEKRANNAQTALILLEGDDERVLRRFGDAIVTKLAALGSDVVSSAEDGVQEAARYLKPRAGLFLDRADLEKMKADVNARWDWEVSQAVGSALDDEGAPPPMNRAEFEKRFLRKLEDKTGQSTMDQDKEGYYERSDRRALVVIAGSTAPEGDLTLQQSGVDKMHSAVDAARAESPDFANVKVSWAGALVTSLIEFSAVNRDLLRVGITGIVLVLSVLVLYFMRARALVVMGVTIACGLACTFGVTELAIGHLNVATGFLFSIILGNGINVGVIYVARYYEEKRKGASTPHAVRIAHKMTWPSTLVAAVASAAAYASLAVTDFRAFRQFAFVGASGMLLCWVVTVLLLPTLLLLLDGKEMPSVDREQGFFARLRRNGVPYGRFFASVVPKAARPLLVAGLVVASVGIVLATVYVRRDPMEYDLSRIQNDLSESPELHRTWDVVGSILGELSNTMVVLADTPAEAHELERLEQKRWEAAPKDQKPFEAVHSIFDFVPEDQEAKIPTLLALSDRLHRAHERHFVTDADWADIAPYLPPPDLVPFGIADLPEGVARPFTEKNGTRGTIILIQPLADKKTDDLHYLIRLADSFREMRLSDGKVFYGTGRAVIFADILGSIVRVVPRSIGLSLVMTLIAVVITFRRGSHSASVLAALLVGLASVASFMFLAKVRINLLNFAALPVTFGIGVDYAVNVMQRYHADGSQDILHALKTTGGAVVLCSLTTMLGYFALVGSHNQGIRSLGEVAVVGEISCLVAAVLVLPAGWYVLERRRRRERSPLSQPSLPRFP
jgi:predicted RND superfamily exporter protein